MSTRQLWYFAHPYAVHDEAGQCILAAEEANFHLCCQRAAKLLSLGYLIYAPICHLHPIHRASAELMMHTDWEFWMGIDEEYIEQCGFHGLILAPGWRDSVGCCRERELFRGHQVKLYNDEVRFE